MQKYEKKLIYYEFYFKNIHPRLWPLSGVGGVRLVMNIV